MSSPSSRHAIRLMLMVLALTALPFGLKRLETEFNARMVASTEKETSRKPASATNRFDLSEIDANEFHKAFKYQLMSEALIITTPAEQGIRLGHFLMRGTDGQQVFGCQQYPYVELVFAAEGIAISGEIPKMTVRGPCLESDDQKTIEAFMIPLKKIFADSVEKSEFRFPIYNTREHITIHFKDVVETWPTQWNLVTIKLYNQDPKDVLTMDGYEIISIMGEPMTLDSEASE